MPAREELLKSDQLIWGGPSIALLGFGDEPQFATGNSSLGNDCRVDEQRFYASGSPNHPYPYVRSFPTVAEARHHPHADHAQAQSISPL
jgi:hypothetical protein